MEFFDAFGINLGIVIAQLVNFGILLFVLYKILYTPILNFVEERTNKIERGVEHAKQAEQALKDASEREKQLLAEARREAASLVEAARANAKEQEAAILEKAKKEVAAVVQQGKKTIEAERKKMLSEVKGEVVSMVIDSTQKVLEGAVDENIDQAWLKAQLAKAK